ncbi:MAG: hypothetical protein AB8W37_06155 [Arsenophonus endosymbiont of Dermacentor nuttalli]
MRNPNLSVKVTRLAYVMGIDKLSVVPSCDGKLLHLYLHEHLLILIQLAPEIKHWRFNKNKKVKTIND